MKKTIWIIVVVVLLGLAGFCYFKFFFVFGEGVKSGTLNFVVYKGMIWKTYEGKLIQSGIKGTQGSMQSYDFEFSISNEAVAKELMLQGGKSVELHYKEYFGRLPWRGNTKYLVDSIIYVRDNPDIIEGDIPPTSDPSKISL